MWVPKGFPFYGVTLTYADSAHFWMLVSWAEFKNVQNLHKSKWRHRQETLKTNDDTGPKVNKGKLWIGQKMSAMNAYQTGCFCCRVVSRQSHCSFYLNQKSLVSASHSLLSLDCSCSNLILANLLWPLVEIFRYLMVYISTVIS